MIIYLKHVNGIAKWFEDESCTQLHHSHKSSEIKNKVLHNEKILKSLLCKVQRLSEEIQELKNNH